jgi:hypothetical protein
VSVSDGDAVSVPPVSGLVDWHELLTNGAPDPEWLLEPLLPLGRLVSVVAGAKTGKSLLLLEAGLALATGRPFLDTPKGEPKRVLYLDYEMTENDLAERVEDMGYGLEEQALLSENFAYYLSPNLPALNTAAGATQLLALADYHEPDLLIVDTLSRVFEGDENGAEAFQKLYRLAWMPLKQRGVTVVRADHTGHNESGRGRGSSAKGDDVDVAWTLKKSDAGVRIECKAARVSWVPKRFDLIRSDDGTAPIHRMAAARGWLPGTAEWVDLLNEIDAPADLGERKLRQWLNEPGRLAATGKDKPPRGNVLTAAIRLRNNDAGAAPDAVK